MDLGTAIKNIRKTRGQTQIEFASSCGITQTYLSQIESNSKQPLLSTLEDISNRLNVPLPILFFLSLDENDINPEKKEAFELLNAPVKRLIDEFFN